jgi:hypothetical protein
MEVELALLCIDKRNFSILDIKSIGLEEESDWIVQQYSRSEKGLLQPGFRIHNSQNVKSENLLLFVGNTNKKNPLHFDKRSGYFFEPPVFDTDGNLDDSLKAKPTGISNAGSFFIEIYSKEHTLRYRTKPVTVLPSILSVIQYKKMVANLLNLHEDLVLHKDAKIFMRVEERSFPKKILSLLKNIEFPLKQINEKPQMRLDKEWVSKPVHMIKKWPINLILDKQLNPHKEKYRVEQLHESKEIYENQKILNELDKIEDLIRKNQKKCKEKITYYSIQKTQLTVEIKRYEKKHFLSNDERQLLGSLKAQHLNIYDQVSYYEALLNEWKNNEEIVIEFLSLPIFKGVKSIDTPWVPTQLFVHHPSYSVLYSELQSLQEYHELFDNGKTPLAIENITQVFEVWTYFEMVKLLQRHHGWEIEDINSLSQSVNQHLKTHYGKLDGFEIKLIKNFVKHPSLKLSITFNKALYLAHMSDKKNKSLRPDYTFEIGGPFNKKTFYLDAKYHNYRENPEQWTKTLLTIWKKYYLETNKDPIYKSEAAYIVHCVDDNQFLDFGGNRGLYRTVNNKKQKTGTINHRLGSFQLSPNKPDQFLTWMRMIVEWYAGYYMVCWNCGESDPAKVNSPERFTETGYRKYFYTCQTCKDVWVKTHCTNRNCKCDPLIKHSTSQQQFHAQSEDDWIVYCPKCHARPQRRNYG